MAVCMQIEKELKELLILGKFSSSEIQTKYIEY